MQTDGSKLDRLAVKKFYTSASFFLIFRQAQWILLLLLSDLSNKGWI